MAAESLGIEIGLEKVLVLFHGFLEVHWGVGFKPIGFPIDEVVGIVVGEDEIYDAFYPVCGAGEEEFDFGLDVADGEVGEGELVDERDLECLADEVGDSLCPGREWGVVELFGGDLLDGGGVAPEGLAGAEEALEDAVDGEAGLLAGGELFGCGAGEFNDGLVILGEGGEGVNLDEGLALLYGFGCEKCGF